ncbi:hypothetical protein [Paracerasibacillus soli]|uniref:Uncharacterized protein n=1 Tax=Paracerasibacillus soli TaxID=480284 RepID=A0ABU5CRH7_9BACI|nr:hypothetical protein [Virgibacillus soli]MDY0408977.1 hypothetical protein [Virgibacillus soli]
MSNKVDPRVKRTKKLFENALLDLMTEKELKKLVFRRLLLSQH